MTMIKTMTVATIPARRSLRIATSGAEVSGSMDFSGNGIRSWLLAGPAVHDTENNGDKYQCGDCCEDQAADDRAAERCVLLAAFTEAQRHRHHANDHRQSCHQNRPRTHESGIECGGGRVADRIKTFARKADHKYAIRGCDP